jgi:hypothetical protein
MGRPISIFPVITLFVQSRSSLLFYELFYLSLVMSTLISDVPDTSAYGSTVPIFKGNNFGQIIIRHFHTDLFEHLLYPIVVVKEYV